MFSTMPDFSPSHRGIGKNRALVSLGVVFLDKQIDRAIQAQNAAVKKELANGATSGKVLLSWGYVRSVEIRRANTRGEHVWVVYLVKRLRGGELVEEYEKATLWEQYVGIAQYEHARNVLRPGDCFIVVGHQRQWKEGGVIRGLELSAVFAEQIEK